MGTITLVTSYGDGNGVLAAVVTRGGHAYIKRWVPAWEPRAGEVSYEHVAGGRVSALGALTDEYYSHELGSEDWCEEVEHAARRSNRLRDEANYQARDAARGEGE